MSKWIKCSDRLPEEGQRVLASRVNEPLHVDYMIDLSPAPPIWACIMEDEYAEITHWMPLPEPPNE